MFQLRTLGSLDLRRDGRPIQAVLRQPKRLALLAYLAISTPRRFHRRDALLALFWPELDQAHARAALRRAIYFVRRAAGDDIIVGRGEEELGVPESGFWCDTVAFEEAMAAGQYAAAAELYRGDLLEGFFVSQAPEFERWLDLERGHLRERAGLALRHLVEEAVSREQWDEAATWARRAAALAPYDETAFRRLITLLERTGNRAAALRACEEFSARLKATYEIEPSPETQALIRSIRERPALAGPTTPAGDAPAASVRRPIAVFPFTVRGAPTLDYLGEGMVDLLSTKLEGAGELRTIAPRTVLSAWSHRAAPTPAPDQAADLARSLQAGGFVLGSILAAGSRLEMTATLHRPGEEDVVTAHARGEVEGDLFDMVDEVARQLLAGTGRRPGRRLTRLAALTTGNLGALKSYLRGEHDLRQGRYFEAMDHLQQAVEDPDFALAWYRLAAARAASVMPELAREAAARAHDLRPRLAPRERILLDAQRAWLAGAAAEAESLYQATVLNYPDDVEAWFLLGDLRMHVNPLRGRSVTEARADFERTLALEPEHVTATVQLARIAALEGRHADRDRLIARVIELSPDSDRALPMEALGAFARRDPGAIERVIARLKEARALTVGIAFADVALYADNLEGAERLGREFLPVARSADLRAVGHIALAHILAAQGRWNEARQELEVAGESELAWALEVKALFSATPHAGASPAQVEQDRAALLAWDAEATPPSHHLALAAHNGLHSHFRHYLLGLLAVRAGDRTAAAAALSHLEELEHTPGTTAIVGNLVQSLVARIREQEGDPAAALRALESMRRDVWFQLTVASPILSQALDRRFRSELLQRLGREEESARWKASIAERSPFELPFAFPEKTGSGGG